MSTRLPLRTASCRDASAQGLLLYREEAATATATASPSQLLPRPDWPGRLLSRVGAPRHPDKVTGSGRAVTRPLSNQFARHVVPKLDLPCRAANQTFSRKKNCLTAPEAPSTSKSPLRCRVVKTSDTGSEWRALCNLATPEGEAELSRPCRLLSEGDADTFVTHRGLV